MIQRTDPRKIFSLPTFYAFNLLVLLVLPQLNNVHYDPLPQFSAEITCAWASVSLFLLTCFFMPRIYVPRISVMLIILGVFFCIQPYFVHIDYIGLSYAAALELFICLLFAISVNTIIHEYGIQWLLTTIAWCLIVGAILQSIIGILQFSGLYRYFGDLIFYDSAHPTSNIFGHFGQRNHYCHYLSWAVFGLIYLYHQHKLKLFPFILVIVWLLFSITIASSRSVFIYFAGGIIISSIYTIFITTDKRSYRRLLYLIILVALALVICEYAYPILMKLAMLHNNTSSGLERIATSSGADGGLMGRRLIEWQKAYIVFKHAPLIGCGLNEYARQSVYLQSLFTHVPANDGLFTNCHNLILQFLAETGCIGTGILILGTLYALIKIIRQHNIETVIILCMFFTTFAHSMLEYPLWYMYFLVPCIMFLSIDEAPFLTINNEVVAALAIIPVSAIVYLMLTGSFICNTLVGYIDVPKDTTTFIAQAKYLENLVNKNTLWAYPAMYTLDNYIIVDNKNTLQTFNVSQQLAYENYFSNFHPYPENLIKQAMLNWNLGNKVLASQQAKLAMLAFPVYQSEYKHSLRAAKYAPLLKIVGESHAK